MQCLRQILHAWAVRSHRYARNYTQQVAQQAADEDARVRQLPRVLDNIDSICQAA
jgi:hypothetical protein